MTHAGNLMKSALFALAAALVLMLGWCMAPSLAFAEDAPLQVGGTLLGDPEPVHADGWELVDSNWNYWKDGVQVKGAWVDTDAKPSSLGGAEGTHRYWLDKDGNLAVNRLVDPGNAADAGSYLAYATEFGYVATEAEPIEVKGQGWVLPCSSDGHLLVGARKVIGNRVYLAKDNGFLQTGNVKVNGKLTPILKTGMYSNGAVRCYYIDPDKHCAIARTKARVIQVGEFGYALALKSKYGYLLAGAREIVGKKVYLAKSNGLLQTGNVKVNGKLTDILKTKAYDKGTVRYYYIDPDKHCAVVTNKAVKVKRYGWVLPSSKKGYLATDGRKVVNNKVYLARANGKLETGNKQGFLSSRKYNKKAERLLYYINPKTNAITYGKPVKVKGFGWVYAPGKGGNLLTQSKKVDDSHILLVESNGRICNKKGWNVTSAYTGETQRYWVETTKANKSLRGARIGSFKVKGYRYVGTSSGYVVRNDYQQIGDVVYYANNSGKLEKDDIVTRMYQRAQGYSSPTRYLIMVDIDDPQTVVFEGSEGNWSIKFIWDCCTGAPETPTVVGTFSLGAKGYSFGEGNGYSCYYWSQISGDYLFHTRLYYANTWNLMAGAMGSRVSHGCVRLMDDAAYWIWTEAPSGTTVACIV